VIIPFRVLQQFVKESVGEESDRYDAKTDREEYDESADPFAKRSEIAPNPLAR
jgi:hypothetical protein